MKEWDDCNIDDLWILDKLLLSKKLGYICGPRGVPVPKSGYYIVRPCVNLMGMGRGASIEYLGDDFNGTDDLPDGSFWCEIFKGRHLSVDYNLGSQVLCVEGYRSSEDLSRWDKWEKVEDKIKLPKLFHDLKGRYPWINVEMIDGNIIEIHLRRNPDFQEHEALYVIPVYDRELDLEDHVYIHAPDHNRMGFFIKKR